MSKKQKLSKDEKKELKAQKKAEKKANAGTPEAIETKQTVIKAVTAVVCVIALCLSSTSAVGKYCEALAKAAEAKGTTAVASDDGAVADDGSSYVDASADTATDDGTAADDGTVADDATAADPAADTATDNGTTATTPAADNKGGAAAAANSKGLTSTDPTAVAAFYNKAVKATEKSAPKGHQTMKLDGGITGDGGLGAVLKVASPIIENTLEKNSTDTDYIPGHEADLLASDIKSCSAVSKNGVTTLTIMLKDQKDGPTADAHTAGPVARGIGTLGNVDGAIEALGAELYSGKDTIVLNYNDAYIKQLTIDENTGKITHGTWHYKVNVTVGNAEIKLGMKFTAKNLKACIDYTVVI